MHREVAVVWTQELPVFRLEQSDQLFADLAFLFVAADLIDAAKVFDIVRTTTGGNFDTSVLAYEFYVQSFRSFNNGLGWATPGSDWTQSIIFAILIMILVFRPSGILGERVTRTRA